MGSFIAILNTALPVLVALCLGMLCRKTGFLDRHGVDSLKKVVIQIALPAVLFDAFATAEYSLATVAISVLIFALCSGGLVLGKMVAKLFRMNSRLAPFLATGFEAGMLGYAMFLLLFPEKSLSEFAVLDIGHTLFVFTLYKMLLSGKTDWRAMGKDMVTTPVLWAVVLGVLTGATGLYGFLEKAGVSAVVDSITSFVGAPTAMIILLTVGYDLVLGEIPWKKTIGLIVMRLVIMALLFAVAVLLNRTLLNNAMFEGAILLMCILPPPYVVPVFADEPAERVQVSASLSALTLISLILFTACSVLLRFI